jgi:uncharacterized protein (TIGR03437 family)
MLTLFRLAPSRSVMYALIAGFFALGSFDTVQAQSVLTVSSTTLNFTATVNQNPSNVQNVSVGSTTGSGVSYLINTNATWISASTGAFNGNSGITDDVLTVQVYSASLAVGSYTGAITLTPSTGNPVSIAVGLTVSGSGGGPTTSKLSASPAQLSFAFQLAHAAPPSQTVQITSSGIALPFSFTTTVAGTSNCTQSWLQVTASTNSTPATLTVNVSPTGLSAGTCTGNISLTSTTQANGTTTAIIGISLFINSGPLLNVNIPSGLSNLTLQQGGRPVQFNVGLSSSDSTVAIPYTAAVTAGNSWLAITPASGTTLGQPNITVQVTPGFVLAVGPYAGAIQITSPGLFNNSVTIPIALTITSSSSVTVTPSGTQSFTQLQFGALPGSQVLTLTGSTTSNFTTSVTQGTGGSWLNVSPQNGTLSAANPASITLSVAQNSLTQGTYSAQVVIAFQNSSVPSITIFVSLTVAPPASALLATPPTVAFSYQAGGSPPAAQSIAITNPAAGSLPYSVSAVSDSWISINPASGSTPGNISVSVSPQSLQPGSYTGSFTLASPGISSTTVTVSLFVSATSVPQPFIIGNAASGVGSQLAPGEIISIKGSGLGPGIPVSFTVSSLTNPILAGVQVTFDGFSGTLLYVSSTQINVTVPYEITGHSSTSVVVTYQGVPSAAITQPVGAAALGLFTNNATGSGQASVLNQNYSYNTPATPAFQGSYIALYATGGGQTNPASIDGQVSPTTSLLPLALQQITATIGGKAATVAFAGAAPGYVTGVVQLNIQVPTGVSGSALPIVVSINNGGAVIQSQSGATVAVQ